MKLENSPECAAGKLCVLCRDPRQHSIRDSLAGKYEVPADWPACPFGKPLVELNVPRLRRLPPPKTAASVPTRAVAKIAANPKIAERIARKRIAGEKGVGDTLERLLSKVGGNVFKAAYQKITGRSCGCGDVKAKLNADFPYPVE